ncbi:MAG: hypothetical protein AB1486_19645 [Planctomycetota bacterium]
MMAVWTVLLPLFVAIPQDEDAPKVLDQGKFIVKQQDQIVGRESFTLTLDAEDYYIEGEATVDPGVTFKNVLLVCDETFRARRVSMTVETPQGPQKIKLGFRETTVSGSMEAGGQKVSIQRSVPKDPIVCRIGSPFFAWIPMVRRVDLNASPDTKPIKVGAVVLELLQQQESGIELDVSLAGKETTQVGSQEMSLFKIVIAADLPQAGRFEANVFVDDKKNIMKVTIPIERIEVVRASGDEAAGAEEKSGAGGEAGGESGGG